MRKLTRNAFVEWLKDFSAKSIVGISTKANSCPIATFLGRHAYVDEDQYGTADSDGDLLYEYGDCLVHETPAWAKRFIRMVDHSKTVPVPNSTQGIMPTPVDITAARALEVLRKAR